MWWGNKASLDLWNADSLEELLNRNYSGDMSEATSRRLKDYLERFQNDERFKEQVSRADFVKLMFPFEILDGPQTILLRRLSRKPLQWTYYPKGKGPTTVNVCLSGIFVEGGRLLMLNEAASVATDEIDQSSLRGIEMLRHLPVSVCQFNIEGEIMHQNPEALDVFGSPERKRKASSLVGDPGQKEENHFCSRFVDKELGNRVFEEVAKNGNDYCVEAQQYTKSGPRWTAIKVRRARDPVTESPVILYSARDITDVIEAKKEADEANMQKSEFLAVMAHEIRTPLHQVIGFIELLGQTDLTIEQTEFVHLLNSSALSLMAIINDLLDYTKLEAGKMDLESIPFEPKGVVDGIVAAIEGKVKAKGLEIQCFQSSGIPVKIVGDPNRLRQILLNLVNNATKFSHKGTIRVSMARIKEDPLGHVVLRFCVEDTGIGISPEHQQHIFKKYKQADPSVARNYGGTGLGLAICQSLVNLMGGKIGVESEVGKGSNFWFELPFQRCLTRSKVDIEKDLGCNLSGLKILVAEDNKVNQKVVAAMLKRMGHLVTLVDNGRKAIEIMERQQFDVILMDVQMPVLDGIEATKEIRSRGWKSPVIGLTASFQRSEIDYYREIGMDSCISKPVLLKDLRATIFQSVNIQK